MKLTVLANSQSSSIGYLLQQASSEIELLRTPPVHTISKDNLDMVLNTVSQCDVVIHQPIGEHFGPISSDSLKSHFPNKRFISFPSIFFAGLLPYLSYLRQPEGGTLQGPLGDYHDLRILKAYRKGISETACLNSMNDVDIDAQAHFQTCWEESCKREKNVDIPVMHWIEKRIKETQIFYTFNHVDNELLWGVARSVIDLLQVKPDGISTPPITKMLANVIASTPTSVTTALGCQWENSSYFLQEKEYPMQEMISQSYAVYAAVENIDKLMDFNRHRFPITVL